MHKVPITKCSDVQVCRKSQRNFRVFQEYEITLTTDFYLLDDEENQNIAKQDNYKSFASDTGQRDQIFMSNTI